MAEAIGGRTVAELKASMSYREFIGWVVYLSNQTDDAKHRK